MRDNFSCLANSILKYIARQRASGLSPGSLALYNGWATTEKRTFGYSRQERLSHSLKLIESLKKSSDEELRIMMGIEIKAGTLEDYCETSD
jgi:hypothetical protein